MVVFLFFVFSQAAGAHETKPMKGMSGWCQSILRLWGVVLIVEVTSYPLGIIHN